MHIVKTPTPEFVKPEYPVYVAVLNRAEYSDVMNAIYFAMKRLDESGGDHDKALADRLEQYHDRMNFYL